MNALVLQLHLCISLLCWTGPTSGPPWHAAQAFTPATAIAIITTRAHPHRHGLLPLSSSADEPSTLNPQIASAAVTHHVAIKTRNITTAVDFYSLLGFRVEARFKAGPARAAWLLHDGYAADRDNSDARRPQSRIELLEVPGYMLDEAEGTKKRAIDLTKKEALLGLNHLALDVTGNIPVPADGGAAANGTLCAPYQLQDWIDDLDTLSVKRFGKTLRRALPPVKRIIGREVYEMAFLYDADGALVELLRHVTTLEQDMVDPWKPWEHNVVPWNDSEQSSIQ